MCIVHRLIAGLLISTYSTAAEAHSSKTPSKMRPFTCISQLDQSTFYRGGRCAVNKGKSSF